MMAVDVFVDGTRAYVADTRAGLRILDVQDPSFPQTLGEYEGIGPLDVRSAVAKDSFAFITWWGNNRRFMRVLDVTDPASPVFAAEESCKNPPEGFVLRDSLLYAAEEYLFQVFNVARPREPARTGNCGLAFGAWDMDVEDSVAYVTSNVLTMVSTARPDSPHVVGTWNTMVAVDVEDTIAYTIGSGAVWSVSVAKPSEPYLLDTVGVSGWVSDIVVGDTLAFAGGAQLYVINVADPRNLRVVGQWTPPYEFRRLLWTPTRLYAVCYEAGMYILETTPEGIEDRTQEGGGTRVFSVSPSITDGPLAIKADSRAMQTAVCLYDAAGARVNEKRTGVRRDGNGLHWWLDLSSLPDGIYFVNLPGYDRSFTTKVVKTRRR